MKAGKFLKRETLIMVIKVYTASKVNTSRIVTCLSILCHSVPDESKIPPGFFSINNLHQGRSIVSFSTGDPIQNPLGFVSPEYLARIYW